MHPLAMVFGGVAGKKALAWRRDVGVANVREHGRCSVRQVLHDSSPEFVSRSLEPEREMGFD